VLYIEEVDSDTKTSDMRCFIVFDEYEKEYLIKLDDKILSPLLLNKDRNKP
jgi:hypothetical protein